MELRQLRFLVTVADLGSYTRAAERLHVAQPAISVGIRKLEDELGLRLLNRQPQERRVTPTPEGEAMLAHARAILAQVDGARREMAGLRGLEHGELEVAIPTMLGAFRFAPRVAAFQRRYPGLRLSVPEVGARSVQQAVATGRLAMGIVAVDDLPEVLEARAFTRVELVACVPKAHPLAERTDIHLRELARGPLILFPSGYYQRDLISALLAVEGVTPRVVCETNLVALMKQLVAQGSGLGVLLRGAIDASDHVTAVPFDPALTIDVAVCWKRGRQLSVAEQAFVDFLCTPDGG